MKITLVSDDTVRYDDAPGPMTIEAASADKPYTAFHMLASAVASCTHATVRSWASNAGVDANDLAVEVKIVFAEHPHRAGEIDVTLLWPSLPPERMDAAKRAAALCSVHQTLLREPRITTTVANGLA
ncbi:MAG TPA: OsmC family protein [Candidatus Elarobacter sp.]|nr:OsmC family protein [Candidatus Elarobacter sp.]